MHGTHTLQFWACNSALEIAARIASIASRPARNRHLFFDVFPLLRVGGEELVQVAFRLYSGKTTSVQLDTYKRIVLTCIRTENPGCDVRCSVFDFRFSIRRSVHFGRSSKGPQRVASRKAPGGRDWRVAIVQTALTHNTRVYIRRYGAFRVPFIVYVYHTYDNFFPITRYLTCRCRTCDG